MITRSRFKLLLMFLIINFLLLSLAGCKGHLIGMLNPKGIVASEERKLLFDTLALMLIVVLPVIVMSFTFVYHYQVSHRIKEYKPNWSHSLFLESIWWAIPCIIIFVLAIITWKKTHELDPFTKIASYQNAPPLQIQAIALPWKWLFIYPQYNIATVNYLMLPVEQQIEFWMTTDNVPMSAFFIPQLGSQIYTMAGMRSKLFLLANEVGEYDGMNSQYNGAGFSDMHFVVRVVLPEQMQAWVNQVKQSAQPLNDKAYTQLLTPTINNGSQFFSGVMPNLFKNVVDTYMNSLGTIHPRQEFGQFGQFDHSKD